MKLLIVWSYYFFCLESTCSSETLSVYVLQLDSVRISAVHNKIYRYSFTYVCICTKQNAFWITCVL